MSWKQQEITFGFLPSSKAAARMRSVKKTDENILDNPKEIEAYKQERLALNLRELFKEFFRVQENAQVDGIVDFYFLMKHRKTEIRNESIDLYLANDACKPYANTLKSLAALIFGIELKNVREYQGLSKSEQMAVCTLYLDINKVEERIKNSTITKADFLNLQFDLGYDEKLVKKVKEEAESLMQDFLNEGAYKKLGELSTFLSQGEWQQVEKMIVSSRSEFALNNTNISTRSSK